MWSKAGCSVVGGVVHRPQAVANANKGLLQVANTYQSSSMCTTASSGVDGGAGMGKLVLLRHGQSAWNRRPNEPNRRWRYAGSVDIPLSPNGVREAVEAGKSIFKNQLDIDVIFCSMLERARTTAMLALLDYPKTPVIMKNAPDEAVDWHCNGVYTENPRESILPVYCRPEFNERNFGSLQSVSSEFHTQLFTKAEMTEFRNSYKSPFPGEHGESSEDVYERVIPTYLKYIAPLIMEGKNVMLCSHGFVVRAVIKYLHNMSEEEWNRQMLLEKTDPGYCKLLAPTGTPLVFHFEKTGDTIEPILDQSPKEKVRALDLNNAPY